MQFHAACRHCRAAPYNAYNTKYNYTLPNFDPIDIRSKKKRGEKKIFLVRFARQNMEIFGATRRKFFKGFQFFFETGGDSPNLRAKIHASGGGWGVFLPGGGFTPWVLTGGG